MPAPWENKIKVFKHWLFRGHIIRKIKISDYLKKHKIRKIQIASGELPVKEEGWLTADIYRRHLPGCYKEITIPR